MASQDTLNEIRMLNDQNIPTRANELSKKYYDPIVKPLIEEGGNLMSDWISSFSTDLAANPSAGNTISPETVLANAMKSGGRKFGLFQANQNSRDYWGGNANTLAKQLIDYYSTKLNSLQTQYGYENQSEQFNKNLDWQREQFNRQNGDLANTIKSYKELLTKKYLPTAMPVGVPGATAGFVGAAGKGGGGGNGGAW